MPTWSASPISYLNHRKNTEIRPSEETLCLGKEVIVLEEYHIASFAILGEEIFSFETFLIKLLVCQQLGEFEFVACVEGGVPVWTALYPCFACASSRSHRTSGPLFFVYRARVPIESHSKLVWMRKRLRDLPVFWEVLELDLYADCIEVDGG